MAGEKAVEEACAALMFDLTPFNAKRVRAALDAAAAVDGDDGWNAAIEAAAQMLDNNWDGERGDAIRSLKRLK